MKTKRDAAAVTWECIMGP